MLFNAFKQQGDKGQSDKNRTNHEILNTVLYRVMLNNERLTYVIDL